MKSEKLNFLLYNNSITVLNIILAFFLATSCQQKQLSSLKKQDLFSLNYGSFENELTMFNLNTSGEINTYIYMQDGFFFIANGEAKKVMQFTSYGDIIGVYYNPETNPTPSFVSIEENIISEETSSQQSQTSTQQFLEYPFMKIGKITADSKKNWFIVDQLPIERQEVDVEKKLSLKEVVLRFSSEGKYIDYLGQQGPGGTPFPFISNIYTTANDELVVVSQSTEGLIAYWFSNTGFLKYTIPVYTKDLPKISDIKNENLFVSLDTIIPDYIEQKLYVKVDYQTLTFDESTKAVSGVDFLVTHLYILDINTGVYDSPIVIPPYEHIVSDGFSKLTYKIPLDFFGATQSGWLFFMIADETGFIVQMVQLNGQRILLRHIDMDFLTTQYQNFSLSPNGIISAIQIQSDKATVSWWRTDSLIESLIK